LNKHGVSFDGGIKHEVKHALKIDGTPLQVYASMQQYRQAQLGNWHNALEKVSADLQKIVSTM
jgi:hypothetical protein